MQHETEMQFKGDGQAVFEKIITIWPPIIRQRRKEKILLMLSLLMQSRRLKKAGGDLVIEATRLVVPKSYDPLFHMIEDMEKFRKKMLDPFQDREAYNRIPVQVRRWKKAGRKISRQVKGPKKVLAFCASPRRHGNTDMLIDEALKGARDAGAQTEKVMLQKIKMGHCIGCRKCKEPGYDDICVIKDDMAGLYQKIIAADAVIIGFPIYTGRECAQLCTFLDRWDGYERYMLKSCLAPGRIAMVIGTWGYPYIDTYDHVIESVISTLNLHKVETVEALSACGFEGILHGLDEKHKGVIAGHPKQLKKAYAAGAALVK
ncbi:MAG: flavodoxin family protein [Deltaproteobacteria bacterium]|nr:flavodoxin family protein [Deltaproteobacteria bacterium]